MLVGNAAREASAVNVDPINRPYSRSRLRPLGRTVLIRKRSASELHGNQRVAEDLASGVARVPKDEDQPRMAEAAAAHLIDRERRDVAKSLRRSFSTRIGNR
jgi:hypothetical protein